MQTKTFEELSIIYEDANHQITEITKLLDTKQSAYIKKNNTFNKAYNQYAKFYYKKHKTKSVEAAKKILPLQYDKAIEPLICELNNTKAEILSLKESLYKQRCIFIDAQKAIKAKQKDIRQTELKAEYRIRYPQPYIPVTEKKTYVGKRKTRQASTQAEIHRLSTKLPFLYGTNLELTLAKIEELKLSLTKI